jgi:hypothetical protein
MMAIFGFVIMVAFIFLLFLSFWLSIKPLKLKEAKHHFNLNSISAKDAKKAVEQDRKKKLKRATKEIYSHLMWRVKRAIDNQEYSIPEADVLYHLKDYLNSPTKEEWEKLIVDLNEIFTSKGYKIKFRINANETSIYCSIEWK